MGQADSPGRSLGREPEGKLPAEHPDGTQRIDESYDSGSAGPAAKPCLRA